MKLAISNIAWDVSKDTVVYELMKKYGFTGLEIAPTRVVPHNPYGNLNAIQTWAREINDRYGLVIPSMQSIWFGRQEKVFGSIEERKTLISYTKKAIDFAEAIGCKNLVFGCPRNRNIPDNADIDVQISFFRELGDYAYAHNTIIGMEANPPIYNTNYINDTQSALELINCVGSPGFLLSLDVGTMIENQESTSELIGKENLINHVHISESGLKMIEKRNLHMELKEILERGNYQGYISIEMGKTENLANIENAMMYVKEIFN